MLSVQQILDTRHLETITQWMYAWWGHEEGYTYESVRDCMAHSLQKDRLPQTYGLFLRNELIGMYQFTWQDLFPRPDIYPWLANVYVHEPFRNMGYGRFLLSTVSEHAAHLPVRELFLFTSHTDLYEKFGWTYVETVDTHLSRRFQRLYRLDLK